MQIHLKQDTPAASVPVTRSSTEETADRSIRVADEVISTNPNVAQDSAVHIYIVTYRMFCYFSVHALQRCKNDIQYHRNLCMLVTLEESSHYACVSIF